MADLAVESLLEKLQELVIYHAHLIGDAKNELEILERDLRPFKAFLDDSSKKRRKDDSLTKLHRQIRDVVYEAEDIIDDFLVQETSTKGKMFSLRKFKKSKDPQISKQLEPVGHKLRNIKTEFGIKSRKLDAAEDERRNKREDFTIREDKIVGFEDETETLVGYLKEETQQLDVISIIGMPGIGKTTFARKIFSDPHIRFFFPICIWVCISQEFTKKDIFLAILKMFTSPTEEMYQKTDAELAQIVAANLERERFLIVMDDLRSAHDWDEIQIALPKSNRMGKVLITSCDEEIGCYVNRSRPPYKLRFMNRNESWSLLELEVFGESKCPPYLQDLGKLIAGECKGLPIAIVIIGRILAEDYSTSSGDEARREAWRKAYKSMHTYLNQKYYEDLPNQLRDCFLYLGMFPENYEIPVGQLISLWIAEGFIPQKEGRSLEETAEKYLGDLISRKLVGIKRFKSNRKVRTCSIHRTLREICKTEAGREKENLLQEINKSSEGLFEPSLSEEQKFRRLCIHSNVSDFLSSKPIGPGVRSFLCFSTDDIDLSPENTSAIPAAFKLLKVLDVKPIKFKRIPKDLFQLIHLKYIVVSIDVPILPAAFSELWNIQTFIVYTTSQTLEIKADIWKMMQLRCLKTNASATLPKTSRTSVSEGEKLHTLGTISPESCTKEVFERACNLKKLGIRGRLASLLDGNTGSFDSFVKLSNLEKLKLLNESSSTSEGRLGALPPVYKFPLKLMYLTLSGTKLDWHHMSVLSKLDHLEVLKLKDKAFVGPSWEVVDGSFHNLEVLHIGHTDLVVWEASGDHFPKLRHLLLHNCEELREIPVGLADVPTLQQLDLYHTKRAAASARKISEVIQKSLDQKNIRDSAFKLSITDA